MPKGSVSKHSQPSVQNQPKQQKMPLLPPPVGFEYEAFGFLAGQLVASGGEYSLVVDDQTLVVKGVSPRVQRWLSGQELPVSGIFGLYPKSTRSGTTVWLKTYEEGEPELEPGTFTIHGQLVATKGEQQLIRIHRNQPTETDVPFFIKVNGFLPNPKTGQFWQLECLWENGKFSLLDGQIFRAGAR